MLREDLKALSRQILANRIEKRSEKRTAGQDVDCIEAYVRTFG